MIILKWPLQETEEMGRGLRQIEMGWGFTFPSTPYQKQATAGE